jgi:tRNA U34 5-methylaminomethyl-2-thiouridine-forming methyltransferase MnmC
MKTPLKIPLGHELIRTEDGSFTLFSLLYQEACHSLTGAKKETISYYIEGCEILDKSQKFSPLNILEVGFGLGVGLLTTMEMIPSDKTCYFVSLEKDRGLLDWFCEEHRELKLKWNGDRLESFVNNFKISLLLGDGREVLSKFLKSRPVKFHAIYQDAFSPKKNPSLWTKEWFTLLKTASHEEVILSTYSASSSVRKTLHEAGWGVQNAEGFGKKRTSTRALLNHPTNEEMKSFLERSPVKALGDEDLKL